MRDKRTPIPAPVGLRWVVTGPFVGYGHKRCYQLGLFPDSADVDWRGAYKKHFPKNSNFPNGGYTLAYALACQTFWAERGLYRASKKALRRYEREQSADSLLEKLRGRFS